MVALTRVTKDIGTTPLKAPEPDMGNEIIPKDRYLSDDFMQLEWERMWSKVWLNGCREEEIPESGDYITTEIGDESILIVRGNDMKARAFFNVCNHRGNQVKFDKAGSAKTLQCAYHYWEYDLDGTLMNVPDEEDFPQGCPKDKLSLKELPCDTWGGFVWFNLDKDCGPLADFLGVITSHLGPYHSEKMYMVINTTVEWDCNWKVSVDAFNESYHVQAIHPELMYYMDDVDIQIDLYEKHSRYLLGFQTYSPRIPVPDEVPELTAQMMQSIGMNPDNYKGRVADVRADMQKYRRENQDKLGYDYSDFNDDQLTDNYHYYIFPNLTVNTSCNHLQMFRQRPHPTDPNKMFWDLQVYQMFPKGTEPPPLPDHEQFKHGERNIRLVLDQDSVNVPHIQKGMKSTGFDGLWIAHQERRIRHMHKTLMDYVSDRHTNDA